MVMVRAPPDRVDESTSVSTAVGLMATAGLPSRKVAGVFGRLRAGASLTGATVS